MDFTTVRADPILECRELQDVWQQSLPHDAFFGSDVWLNPSVETHWIIVDGAKAGFTTFQLHRTVADTYDQDELHEVGTMYILVVALKPEFRGKGLGTRVKQWHIEHARKHGDIQKLVSNHRVSNTASYRFNLKAGYVLVGVKPGYYPSPREDSNVMEFVL